MTLAYNFCIYALNRNALVVILAGFLIDKLGNRCKSLRSRSAK